MKEIRLQIVDRETNKPVDFELKDRDYDYFVFGNKEYRKRSYGHAFLRENGDQYQKDTWIFHIRKKFELRFTEMD